MYIYTHVHITSQTNSPVIRVGPRFWHGGHIPCSHMVHVKMNSQWNDYTELRESKIQARTKY